MPGHDNLPFVSLKMADSVILPIPMLWICHFLAFFGPFLTTKISRSTDPMDNRHDCQKTFEISKEMDCGTIVPFFSIRLTRLNTRPKKTRNYTCIVRRNVV